MGVLLDEFSRSCAPQGLKKGSTLQPLADVVGDAAQVSARRTSDADARPFVLEIDQRKLIDFHFHRRKLDRDLLAGQPVRPRPRNFLRRKRRWRLKNDPAKFF